MSTPYPAGGEILVNVQTDDYQYSPQLLTLSPVTLPQDGGRTVAVWSDIGSDRIVARFYGPDGQAEGGEVVLAQASDINNVSAVAVDFYGFAVAWGGVTQVQLQFFGPDGAPLGAARTIAMGVFDSISGNQITGWDLSSHGGVVAAAINSHSFNVFQGTNRNDSSVALYGVTGTTAPVSGGPALMNGSMVSDSATGLFWEVGEQTSGGGLVAKSWTFGGAYAGAIDIGPGANAVGAAAPAGGLAVAWENQGDVWLRTTAGGPPVLVNQTLVGAQTHAALTIMADGRIVVGWTDLTGDADVKGRVFNPDGSPATDEFEFGTSNWLTQSNVTLTAGAFGGFTAAWQDMSGQGGDVSGNSIKARTFDVFDTLQTGSALVDHMAGTNGADRLDAGAGADWLNGGRGWDVLVGGAGGDLFALATDGSVDRITDFSRAEGDFLVVFDQQGAVAPGTTALLIYNPASGTLAWDADSDAGAGAPVTIGVLDGPDVALDRGAFAAGFQPSAVRTLLAGGGRQDMVFDWGGQAFDTATTTYRGNGALETYDVRFDDGGRSLRTNDVDFVHSDWSSVVAEYDPQGRLFAYSVFHDDSSRTLWLFDTNDSKFYSRVVEEYDALGRMSQQAAAADDGTAYEKHIDTYDTEPWAYYIDTFAASGARTGHTFYNADGSVFVG